MPITTSHNYQILDLSEFDSKEYASTETIKWNIATDWVQFICYGPKCGNLVEIFSETNQIRAIIFSFDQHKIKLAQNLSNQDFSTKLFSHFFISEQKNNPTNRNHQKTTTRFPASSSSIINEKNQPSVSFGYSSDLIALVSGLNTFRFRYQSISGVNYYKIYQIQKNNTIQADATESE